MSQKFWVLVLAAGFWGEAHATPNFGSALRNEYDQIYGVPGIISAEQRCAEVGGRLPTAREFAELAAERGAQGIREYEGTVPEGYALLKTETATGNRDRFLYSHDGYQMPASEELRTGCYWTSASLEGNPNRGFWGIVFYQVYGVIKFNSGRSSTWQDCAVRCILP